MGAGRHTHTLTGVVTAFREWRAVAPRVSVGMAPVSPPTHTLTGVVTAIQKRQDRRAADPAIFYATESEIYKLKSAILHVTTR